MIKILEIHNQKIWESFVLSHSPQSFFQSWLWGEVQKKQGLHVERYGIYVDETLSGVFQIVLVQARRGSFLHVRHGPILQNTDTKMWETTLLFLKKLAKKYQCWFVRMNPLVSDSFITNDVYKKMRIMPASIHRMDGEQCWVLDLDRSSEELLAQMRKTTRYEIRRAQKEQVEVSQTTNIDEFMELYKKTSLRQGFVGHDGIEQEFKIFSKIDQAVLYIGKHNGVAIAGAMIVYYGNQAIYHHGASIPSHMPVSTLVQWQAILEAKKRGMNVYNFWGIAPEDKPNHPWRGITLFKKGFGGRSVEYLHAMDMRITPLYFISRSIELVRKYMKGYD